MIEHCLWSLIPVTCPLICMWSTRVHFSSKQTNQTSWQLRKALENRRREREKRAQEAVGCVRCTGTSFSIPNKYPPWFEPTNPVPTNLGVFILPAIILNLPEETSGGGWWGFRPSCSIVTCDYFLSCTHDILLFILLPIRLMISWLGLDQSGINVYAVSGLCKG